MLLWADVTKYHARVAEICQHVCLCVSRERACVASERVCVSRDWGAVASDGGGWRVRLCVASAALSHVSYCPGDVIACVYGSARAQQRLFFLQKKVKYRKSCVYSNAGAQQRARSDIAGRYGKKETGCEPEEGLARNLYRCAPKQK